MKFLLAIDHLASYNGEGYEYYEMDAQNLADAKAKVLFNFHKFDQTYLIKIMKPSCYGYLPICNVRSLGEIEAIGKGTPAYYHWAVEVEDKIFRQLPQRLGRLGKNNRKEPPSLS